MLILKNCVVKIVLHVYFAILKRIKLSNQRSEILKFYQIFWVVDLGFTTPLTSQVISVAFYSEREKTDKFCAEALISARGSITCLNLRHGTHGFTSLPKEVILRIFTILKNPSTPAGFELANRRSSGKYDNHGNTGIDLWRRAH